jgi:peroxiredoxin
MNPEIIITFDLTRLTIHFKLTARQQSGRTKLLKSTILSAVILLLAAVWIWASKAPPGSTTNGGIPAPEKGFNAPDFTLMNPEGQKITLSSLRGRPVVINLWASWCGPCRAETPALEKIYKEYQKDGLEVLGVNAANQDNRSNALAFIQDIGITYPILLDVDGSISQLYQVNALPTTFFVKPDGVIQEVVIGGPIAEALLRIRVEELLEDGAASKPVETP